MKNRFRIAIALFAIALSLGFMTESAAQRVLGGYQSVATDDPEVVSAAEFAVSHQAEKEDTSISLSSIEKAERQTVAGANYRICMKVEMGDETKDVRVVVNKNLEGEYSLTSWSEADCS